MELKYPAVPLPLEPIENWNSILPTSADDERLPENQSPTTVIEIWKYSGLDVSFSSLERVQKSLLHVVSLFREENKKEAHQFFVHCVDGLERFMEAITLTRVALRLNFSEILNENRPLSLIEKELGYILKAIIRHQEDNDYISVADRLEYELLPNLHQWAQAIQSLKLSQETNS